MRLTAGTLLLDYVRNFNFPLLRQQKEILIELITNDERNPSTSWGEYAEGDHPAWGIVELIDSLQDYAHDICGIADVFEEETDTTPGQTDAGAQR